MSRADLEVRATQLRGQGVPFVRARVVRAERPTSAKAGDEAIIHADGSIEGFVGGTCAEATVRAQSMALLDSRQPLLLRITPGDEVFGSAPNGSDGPGTMTVRNPCLSGGTMEIFLDPVLPAPLVQIHGDGPIARAVRRLAGELEYRVSVATPVAVGGATSDGGAPADGRQAAGSAHAVGTALAVVVASHGRDEIEVLAAALDAGVPYVALVASRRRGAGVLAELALMRPDLVPALDRIHSPAGLDIGARTAAEIGLSILAEVISARVHTTFGTEPVDPVVEVAQAAVDPVCGMTVTAIESSLHLDHDDRRSYFCGSGCLRAFSANPAGYPES